MDAKLEDAGADGIALAFRILSSRVVSGRITRFNQPSNVQRQLVKESLRSDPAKSAKARPTMWFGQNRERGYEFQISEPYAFSGSLI